MLLSLAEGEGQAPAQAGSRLEAVLQELMGQIEANLSRPLTVPALARSVQMSQNYLARRFRDHFGMTISDYILERRIVQAQYYLQSTALTVGEIGSRVGLPDPQYFNKRFRRQSGMSPTAFRKGSAACSGEGLQV
jgi:AraC-like DNA-binding protein